MRLKNSTLSLLGILLLACSAPAEEVRGFVVKTDPARNEVTIEARGRGLRGVLMTFRIDADTRIMSGDISARLVDVAVGRRLRVIYEARENGDVARLLTGPAVSPAAPAAPAHDANTVAGTLRRISRTDREIVVVGPDFEKTVVVPDSTKITRDQKSIRFEDLKEGEQVAVHTATKDGQLRADSIQAGTVAAANASAAKDDKIQKLRQALKIADLYLQYLQMTNKP